MFIIEKSPEKDPLLTSHNKSRLAYLFNPAFDGVRGLAILLVILSHSYQSFFQSSLDRFWYRVSTAGWIGVDMFFVLSGFLITRILIQSRQTPLYFQTFYIRRALRIFPLYALFLCFFFGAIPFFPNLSSLFSIDRSHFFWHLLFLSNLYFSYLGFYPGHIVDISWSLSIEEQFYLFWPLLVWKSPLKNLRLVCFSLLSLSIGLIFFQVVSHTPLNSTYFFTLTRWHGILCGSALATIILDPVASKYFYSKIDLIFNLSCLLSILSFSQGIHTTSLLVQLLGFPSYAIFFTALLAKLNFNTKGLLLSFFNLKGLRYLGKYSYGLYLTHQPIIILIEKILPSYIRHSALSSVPLVGTLLFQSVSIFICLLCAYLIYHGFEVYFLNLKDISLAPKKLSKNTV